MDAGFGKVFLPKNAGRYFLEQAGTICIAGSRGWCPHFPFSFLLSLLYVHVFRFSDHFIRNACFDFTAAAGLSQPASLHSAVEREKFVKRFERGPLGAKIGALWKAQRWVQSREQNRPQRQLVARGGEEKTKAWGVGKRKLKYRHKAGILTQWF